MNLTHRPQCILSFTEDDMVKERMLKEFDLVCAAGERKKNIQM